MKVVLLLAVLVLASCGDAGTTGSMEVSGSDLLETDLSGSGDGTLAEGVQDGSGDTIHDGLGQDSLQSDLAVDQAVGDLPADLGDDSGTDVLADLGSDSSVVIPEQCEALKACTDATCAGGASADFSTLMCALQSCADEYQQCVGPFGQSSCAEIEKCMLACPAGDTACPVACMPSGTQEAQMQFTALARCFTDSCQSVIGGTSSVATLQCLLQNCEDSYTTCNGPFGTSTCKEMLTCLKGCTGGSECQAQCVASGSYDADLQFLDAGLCIEQNCPEALTKPTENFTCLMGVCAAPLGTCCGGSVMNCL